MNEARRILLRRKAKTLEPTVRIGKSGLSDSQVQEIRKQLRTREIVKIKMLKAFVGIHSKAEIREIPSIVASLTDSVLVFSVGNTFALARKKPLEGLKRKIKRADRKSGHKKESGHNKPTP
ncbi:YhbY family RNA-binding protein [Candidatus Woesearchaeota archaeon]|nr:MAG: YhbY family RNA-binding protein [Candidatus Woesearchaeota archaeon]